MNKKPKLLQQVRDLIRKKGYSYSTEKSYTSWIRQYILFHQKQHPLTLDQNDVEKFLTYLVNQKNVAGATQNQALSALLFLYRDILQQSRFFVDNVNWSRKPKRIPVVLSKDEVWCVLKLLDSKTSLTIKLLYGAGLQVSEVIRLRICDLDFAHCQLQIRSGKGKTDRFTMIPESLQDALMQQVRKVQKLHERDCLRGKGDVSLPFALHKK